MPLLKAEGGEMYIGTQTEVTCAKSGFPQTGRNTQLNPVWGGGGGKAEEGEIGLGAEKDMAATT